MDSHALAQLVAADLGPDVVAAIEAGPPRSVVSLSDAMAVGSFILGCAQLALQIWQAQADRSEVTTRLAESLHDSNHLPFSQTDLEQKLQLMALTVEKLVPEHFGSSPSLAAEGERTKQEWISSWIGSDAHLNKTRKMTSSILFAFLDMDWFAVVKTIYWTPPVEALAELPRIVTVPENFVTDLASIPPYFFWAIRPTGRHGHAAILHDWLYWDQSCPRAVADKVFEVAMAEMNVALPVRKAMWAAVRVFGGRYWNQASELKRQGRSRILKRLPEEPVSWAAWQEQPDVFA